jgi:8-oxo-dGTP diphosphatase
VHFTEYDTRLAAYGLLTTEDGRILLTWFNGTAQAAPCWTMPGGGVEFDESVKDAVAREVFEETGYRVDVGRMLAEHHFTVPRTDVRRPYRSQRFILAATITGGQLGTTEAGGTTDFARWVPIADVPRLEPRADIIDVAMSLLPADHSELGSGPERAVGIEQPDRRRSGRSC